MADKVGVSPNSQPGSLELTERLLCERAYHLFEERGRQHGHDLDDWLQAEAEIYGRKPAASVGHAEGAAGAALAEGA